MAVRNFNEDDLELATVRLEEVARGLEMMLILDAWPAWSPGNLAEDSERRRRERGIAGMLAHAFRVRAVAWAKLIGAEVEEAERDDLLADEEAKARMTSVLGPDFNEGRDVPDAWVERWLDDSRKLMTRLNKAEDRTSKAIRNRVQADIDRIEDALRRGQVKFKSRVLEEDDELLWDVS